MFLCGAYNDKEAMRLVSRPWNQRSEFSTRFRDLLLTLEFYSIIYLFALRSVTRIDVYGG